MFVCDPCATEEGWRMSTLRSRGPCDVCGRTAVCSEIPSRHLPAAAGTQAPGRTVRPEKGTP